MEPTDGMNTGLTDSWAANLLGQPALGLFVAPEVDSYAAPEVEPPISAEVIDAFSAATGWVIGFEESSASFEQRVQEGSPHPTGGKLKIIDMSPSWPARTPTAHRAKCDRFVAALNELISFDGE